MNLDAVAVALVWQSLWAHCMNVSLHGAHRVLLGGAVWIIYTLDHLLDGTRGLREQMDRHRFHRQHQRILRVLLGGLSLVLVWLARRHLNASHWGMAGILSLLTLGYLAWTHWGPGLLNRFPALPKEGWVGWIFAAGTFLIPAGLASTSHPILWGTAWLSTSILFTLNCAFITLRENQGQGLPASWKRFLPCSGWTLFLPLAPWLPWAMMEPESLSKPQGLLPAILGIALASAGTTGLYQFSRDRPFQEIRPWFDLPLLLPALVGWW